MRVGLRLRSFGYALLFVACLAAGTEIVRLSMAQQHTSQCRPGSTMSFTTDCNTAPTLSEMPRN